MDEWNLLHCFRQELLQKNLSIDSIHGFLLSPRSSVFGESGVLQETVVIGNV